MEQLQIVKIETDDKEVNAVNLRNLHAGLMVKTKYADWAKKRLERAIQGVDFIHTSEKSETRTGATVRKEYYLTIEFAKMIAMQENNKQGDKVRAYFIECEKKLTQTIESLEIEVIKKVNRDFLGGKVSMRDYNKFVELKGIKKAIAKPTLNIEEIIKSNFQKHGGTGEYLVKSKELAKLLKVSKSKAVKMLHFMGARSKVFKMFGCPIRFWAVIL